MTHLPIGETSLLRSAAQKIEGVLAAPVSQYLPPQKGNRHWVGVSGTAEVTHPDVEGDVKDAVEKVLAQGKGIVAGGAPGVDTIATKRSLEIDPTGGHVWVIIPTSLKTFLSSFLQMAVHGYMDPREYFEMADLLHKVQDLGRLEEHPEFKKLNNSAFTIRNYRIAETGKYLMAFQINGSGGTQQTINFARTLGRRVEHHAYEVELEPEWEPEEAGPAAATAAVPANPGPAILEPADPPSRSTRQSPQGGPIAKEL